MFWKRNAKLSVYFSLNAQHTTEFKEVCGLKKLLGEKLFCPEKLFQESRTASFH